MAEDATIPKVRERRLPPQENQQFLERDNKCLKGLTLLSRAIIVSIRSPVTRGEGRPSLLFLVHKEIPVLCQVYYTRKDSEQSGQY